MIDNDLITALTVCKLTEAVMNGSVDGPCGP